MLWCFGIFSLVLVYCVKKNLATLLKTNMFKGMAHTFDTLEWGLSGPRPSAEMTNPNGFFFSLKQKFKKMSSIKTLF
jgi:hypothetical protein